MTAIFEQFKQRAIKFDGLIKVRDWSVKLYTITNRKNFESVDILSNVKLNLPSILKYTEVLNLDLYNIGFLMLHEGREGVWIIFSWWVDGEIVQSKVLFSEFHKPNVITDSPYAPSSLICVWELEVVAYERAAWIKHILLNADKPLFDDYLTDVLKN